MIKELEEPAAAAVEADGGGLLAVIDAAYEAALDPGAWPELLERIASRLNGLAVLCSRDETRRSLTLTWARVEGAVPERLLTDPRAQAWMGDPKAGVTSGRTLLDADSEEAADWRRPLGHIHGCIRATISVARGEGVQSTLTVVRAESARFTPGERAWMDLVAPHLRRAIRIAYRLQALGPLEGDARMALDRMRMGVLVLDADLNVLLANRTAESILGAASGLRRLRGKLVISDRAAHARLAAHVRSSPDGGSPGEAVGGGSLRVEGPGRSLTLLVAPLGDRSDERGCAHRSVVFVSDPDAAIDTPDGLFETLFDLTETQARVAVLLMQGHTPEQCAQALGSALSTVRTHLKRIFQKTGTTRQSELVRLLLSSPAAAHHRHGWAGGRTRT